MKLIMPLILIIMFNKFNITVIIMLFLFMNIVLLFSQFSYSISISNLFMLDNISMLMIILSFMSILLIFISSYDVMKINFMITMILLLLIPTFSASNMIMFYIMFEITLIPTLMIITKSGPQPERLQAGIYMLMYTIFASLPLFLSIINIKMNSNMMYSYYYSFNINYPMVFMLAFLVKLPMFMFHLWLPKAHVEAPVEGSMILAAVLLKLGGYGLMRFFPLMINTISKFNFWLISISMIGATATSLNCIRQKDLKSLIAYSSVSHMGFILSSMLTLNHLGMMGAFIMMIAHGFSSSGLFLLVNMIYSKYHTRNIISFKGLINSFPNLMFWWFIFMVINISAPPSINMMSEVMMMSSLVQWNSSMLLMIFILSLSTASFSIFMFINISHNMSEMLPSNQSLSKLYMSLFIHSIPLLMIIMKLEMMTLLFSLTKTMICGIINTLIFFKSNLILMMSMTMLFMSMFLLYNNMFISLEIPLLSFYYNNLNISINLDWLSMLFLASVMFISAMIIKFSYSYISINQHSMFINLMLMFILSMSLLIMSDNIVFILLGWDGLGLSSYILVVYYQNSSSSASGSITILSNRIGDIMILLSIAMMFYMMNWNFSMNEEFNLIIMILLMIAAMSKSAQFPFSAWLPAAMSAPTPISALVHSSTLVTAGVYMLLRIMNFNHPICSYSLMLISSFTAIYASMAAMWEQDMKKIIALSTLSQMAMMMYAISLNVIYVAYFHLISHALFKSMMFLCAGILIHNFMYQDMRHMGSMLKNSPITISMLGIANLSLMGIPFMSGFFSKDSIIEKMISSNLTLIISMIMIMSISMTSLYSFRLINITTKFMLKSKPDMTISSNYIMENSTIKMALFSIMFGLIYMWIYSPNQLFVIPNLMKLLIMMSLFMGMLLAISLSFKSYNYLKFGQPAISLWFTHMMTSNSMFNLNKYMKQSHNNDKLWQESYGPYNSFNYIMMSSSLPNNMIMSSMCIIMLIMIIPIILMM